MNRCLVVGTRNAKKRGELLQLLALPGLELRTMADYPWCADVLEDGNTFLENATKKAVQLSSELQEWVFAEDSGLCVDALDGAPGVYSARYAGEPPDDARNNEKLLDRLSGVPEPARSAFYICTIVVADPRGRVRAEAEGRCNGRIGETMRGDRGFGYDPLFLFGEGDKSFGELSVEFKMANSHRAAAVRAIRPQLASLLL